MNDGKIFTEYFKNHLFLSITLKHNAKRGVFLVKPNLKHTFKKLVIPQAHFVARVNFFFWRPRAMAYKLPDQIPSTLLVFLELYVFPLSLQLRNKRIFTVDLRRKKIKNLFFLDQKFHR